MKMALQDGIIKIIEADNVQFTIIKSWNKMKWDKKNKMLTGLADIELLDKLAGIVRLPPAIDTYRGRLHRVQDAVDREPLPAPNQRREHGSPHLRTNRAGTGEP